MSWRKRRERERGKEKCITVNGVCVCHTVLHVHVLTALTFLVLASALISEGEAGVSVFLNNKSNNQYIILNLAILSCNHDSS